MGHLSSKGDQRRTVNEDFHQYAAGMSPRSIANELNARRVPSPGADWKRKTGKRRDGKWLAFATHGATRERSKAQPHTRGRPPSRAYSGLLTGSECGSRFVIVSKSHYGRAINVNGDDAACGNRKCVKRSVTYGDRDPRAPEGAGDRVDPPRRAGLPEDGARPARDAGERTRQGVRDPCPDLRADRTSANRGRRDGGGAGDVARPADIPRGRERQLGGR